MGESNSSTKKNMTNTHRRAFLKQGTMTVAAAAIGAAAGRMTAPVTTTPDIAPAKGSPRFKDKVIVITGATSGIGSAAARAFAAEGGHVYFCGRRSELGQQVQESIRASGGDATYIHADVRLEEDVQAFIHEVLSQHGRLDIAFNNAGITIERPLHEIDTAAWENVLNTNLRGVYYAMKYQLLPMLNAKSGSILVTSSVQGLASRPGGAAYSASKHALLGLVKAAALDYGRYGIRVNAILPGTTDTEMVRRQANAQALPEPAWNVAAGQWARSNVPGAARMASADEVAAFAVDIASNRYPYMTGATPVIDGGMTAALP